MGSNLWWKATLENVVSAAASVLLSVLTIGYTSVESGQKSIAELPFKWALSLAGLAALITFLKCVVAIRRGDPDSPSLQRGLALVSKDCKDEIRAGVGP